eukprot:CAMPEP_0176125378 /NCGR_PEP_ID=MMETSP0120_2-20121206/63246_1 /TAXON_ID=160619 /ORGANISM="Kryptoperidinium foliaceum, Strain CCMP 1326" /LENGTH=166 /DNA_ID=CAMNT_0017460225 /DNA_START=8 /DNA_END=505 /DNA_ORIENTATION=-
MRELALGGAGEVIVGVVVEQSRSVECQAMAATCEDAALGCAPLEPTTGCSAGGAERDVAVVPASGRWTGSATAGSDGVATVVLRGLPTGGGPFVVSCRRAQADAVWSMGSCPFRPLAPPGPPIVRSVQPTGEAQLTVTLDAPVDSGNWPVASYACASEEEGGVYRS